MKVLSDSQFDIKEYFGDLVIIYPENSEDKVREITALFDVSGHVYHSVAVGEQTVNDRGFMETTAALIDGCACLVPVMSGELTKPENLELFLKRSITKRKRLHILGKRR